MILSLTTGDYLIAMLKIVALMGGIFVITLLTPKLAQKIDKMKNKNSSPYGDVPNPMSLDKPRPSVSEEEIENDTEKKETEE